MSPLIFSFELDTELLKSLAEFNLRIWERGVFISISGTSEIISTSFMWFIWFCTKGSKFRSFEFRPLEIDGVTIDASAGWLSWSFFEERGEDEGEEEITKEDEAGRWIDEESNEEVNWFETFDDAFEDCETEEEGASSEKEVEEELVVEEEDGEEGDGSGETGGVWEREE